MAIGAGKYDALCGLARTMASARGCVLLIVDGEHGHGFSVQAQAHITPKVLAETLRKVADEIEKDENQWNRNTSG